MKNNSHAFVNQLLMVLLVSVSFGGSVGVSLVWMRHRNSVVANANRELNARIVATERLISEAQLQVENAQNFAALRRLNSDFKLGLELVTDTQFVHVRGDPVQRLMAKSNNERLSEGPMAVTAPIALAH